MANLNNIYYNAAYCGFIQGALQGRNQTSSTATDYLNLTQAAQAFAQRVDSLIAFDALVTTAANITQLEITTNTIAANEQWRAGLLQSICAGQIAGRFPQSETSADYATLAAAAKACWTEALLLLVTP